MDRGEIDPREVLQNVFGFSQFRPGQEAVVERLLAGRSVLAIFPTGAGKSLCYQLPALMLDGVTVVISPLIALMKDQIDFLRSKGVAAARLDSTLTLEESRAVFDDLRGGRLKLLYIAPERLASERFLETLRRLPIAMLAVDEAHCISEWGHNFRPDYMKLADLARALRVGRVLGLTATATPSVAADIARAFGIAEGDVVKTEFHRKNLVLRVTPVPRGDGAGTPEAGGPVDHRMYLLLERVRSRPRGPTIVYVTLQKTAEEVAGFLAHQGLPAKAYHAGMDPDLRHDVQDWFMASPDAIVVATIAFGMGIDKSDIRYVYHYNLPKSLEGYAQEIGRAGRDGMESTCEVLASWADRTVLENFTYGDTPTARAIGSMLQDLLLPADGGGAGQTFDVSVYDLCGQYDIRPLVADTVLTYLELDGVIASTGPFYNEYKFQPARPSAEMLARFDPERAAFLRAVFKCAQPGRTWLKLDLKQVQRATGATRQRVVAALNYLEEQGELKLEVAGARQGYRRLVGVVREAPAGGATEGTVVLRELAERTVQRFMERERRDIERTGKVMEFVAHEGCRTAGLLEYFGEPLEGPCGHCDVCLGERAGKLESIDPRQVTPEELETVAQLKGERHAALGSARQMARFLCGISSPATTRAKLQKDQRFGMLGDVPFGTVMEAVGGRSVA